MKTQRNLNNLFAGRNFILKSSFTIVHVSDTTQRSRHANVSLVASRRQLGASQNKSLAYPRQFSDPGVKIPNPARWRASTALEFFRYSSWIILRELILFFYSSATPPCEQCLFEFTLLNPPPFLSFWFIPLVTTSCNPAVRSVLMKHHYTSDSQTWINYLFDFDRVCVCVCGSSG